MKSPPVQFTDDEARTKTEEFIKGDDAVVLPGPLKRTSNSNGNGGRKTAKARNGAKPKK
jgi:hypothetical protein